MLFCLHDNSLIKAVSGKLKYDKNKYQDFILKLAFSVDNALLAEALKDILPPEIEI